jgi:hypothetical protein
MTAKILKSEIAAVPGFEAAVARHAMFIREHLEHMARVAADEKNGVEGHARHQPYPAPTAHPAIIRAVDANGNADFTIEDDGPTAAERLALRKADLAMRLGQAERAASDAEWPIAKRRLDNFRSSDISAADNARAQKIAAERGPIAKAILGPKDPKNVWDQAIQARPAADTAFLADHAARHQKIAAIERIAAQAHADIEELTAENIGAWKMPDFTTA